MALIAKEILSDGFTTIALPGNVVSPAMVEAHGWHDKVKDDGRDGDDGALPRRKRKAAEE